MSLGYYFHINVQIWKKKGFYLLQNIHKIIFLVCLLFRQNIYFSDIALANMGKTTAQPESIRLLDWMKGCHLRQTASFVFNSRIHQNALIPSTSSAAGDRGSATTGSQLRHCLYPSVPQPHHSSSVHRPRVVLHTSPMPINGPRFSNHFDRHPPAARSVDWIVCPPVLLVPCVQPYLAGAALSFPCLNANRSSGRPEIRINAKIVYPRIFIN